MVEERGKSKKIGHRRGRDTLEEKVTIIPPPRTYLAPSMFTPWQRYDSNWELSESQHRLFLATRLHQLLPVGQQIRKHKRTTGKGNNPNS